MKHFFKPLEKYTPDSEYLKQQIKQVQKKGLTKVQAKLSQFKKHADLISTLLDLKAKSILSIGSRDDAEVLSFKKEGFDCTGIDLEAQEHIKKIDAHVLNEHFEENAFDLVYANNSLEHMQDLQLVLKQIRYVGKLGLLCQLPCHLDDKTFGANHCSYVELSRHKNNWKRSLEELKDSNLLEDFSPLKEYEIIYYSYDDINNIDDNTEAHIDIFFKFI